MNTQFNVYFKSYIDEISEIIDRLQIVNRDENVKSIALNIVEVEVLFVMLNIINEDFSSEISKFNGEESFSDKKLISKISDIRSLLYSTRLPHWHYLSFNGKVCSARLQKWFLHFSSKSVLVEKMHSYFKIAKRINLDSNNSVSFIPLISANKYMDRINTESKESVLNLPLFDKEGCSLNLSNHYLVKDNLSCPFNRHEIYKIMAIKELNPEPIFAENEIKKINNIIFDKKPNGASIKRVNKNKEFKVKTSVGEFQINEDFRDVMIDNYAEVTKRLESIEKVEKKDRTKITVTLDELKESARLLDKKIGESRFLSVLNDMEFINPKTKSRCTTLTFDGFCNMAGMVNTGKTTFMVIVAVTLAKKGYKTGLVLRDNDDTFHQYRTLLNDTEGINPVPLLGQFSKKDQFAKVLNQNIEFSDNLEESNVFKDSLYEYTAYTCPLKACLVNNRGDEDVFSSLKDREDLLCNSLFCNDEKITCPFVYNCDSVSQSERILDGNVFLTNTYSFAQTAVNKYFIKGERRIAEFLYDSCDLVLFDESDIVQFITDSMFVNSSPIYNVNNYPSIIENIDEYFQLSQGNATKHSLSIDLLNTMSITRMYSFNLLKLLSSNAIPSSLSKGPINSKSVYGFLSWLLTREVECIKSVAKATVDLKRSDVKDFSDEGFEINNENYKQLLNEFKNIANYIYTEYKKEYLSESTNLFSKASDYNTDKYHSFSSYINLVTNQQSKSRLLLENECLDYIFKTKLCNETVVKLIKDNDNIKNMILDVFGFVLMLNKFECDLMQIMNSTNSIKSRLYEISDSDIEDIPSVKPYIKDYRDILSKCPLDMSIGLKYDRENESLSSVLWSNVGRELIYNYSDLWRYVRGDKNSGVNLALLSGTSYMPTSPLYHIEKPVNYLIRTKKDKAPYIKFIFAPEKDDSGEYIFNSGINKAVNGNGASVYKKFAKAFCKEYKNNPTKLDFYLKEYTISGRNRILISVGTYEHAHMLASYIHERIEHIPNSKVKVASLVRENSTNNLHNLNLPSENCLTRQSIKDIENTPFNIVVVPQTALQRGINMVGEDIFAESANGKKVASFSCILKTNRDYQIPNSNEYAVSRVHHKLNRIINDNVASFNNSYSVDSFVKDTITKLNNLYDEYYITKYFAELSDEEREMIIADLCAEDFQFIGRVIRGDSDAFVIMADASFFRAYTKDGSIDNEKTSTIVAIKWMMERLRQRDDETAFLIEELYSPFLNGIYKLLNEKFNL